MYASAFQPAFAKDFYEGHTAYQIYAMCHKINSQTYPNTKMMVTPGY